MLNSFQAPAMNPDAAAHPPDSDPAKGDGPAREPRPGVHFSQGGSVASGVMPPMAAAMFVLMAPMLLMVVPAVVILAADRMLGLPRGLEWAIATALIIGAVVIAGPKLARAYRRGTDIKGLPLAADPTVRVNVICWNDQRAELEPLEDIAFEPEQFRAWLPDRAIAPHAQRLGWIAYAIAMGSFWLLERFDPVFRQLSAGAIIVVGLIVLVYIFRKPTYVRVMPGKVEIRRYPMFAKPSGSTPPDVEAVNLRDQTVVLDFRRGAVMAGPWTQGDVPALTPDYRVKEWRSPALRTSLIPDRDRAERMLYLATISTAPSFDMDDTPRSGSSPVI